MHVFFITVLNSSLVALIVALQNLIGFADQVILRLNGGLFFSLR